MVTRKFVQDRIYDVGSSIEFQTTKDRRERVGVIDEVSFSKNKYQRRITYIVIENETKEIYNVDGELY